MIIMAARSTSLSLVILARSYGSQRPTAWKTGRRSHHGDEEVHDVFQAGPVIPDPILVDVCLADQRE